MGPVPKNVIREKGGLGDKKLPDVNTILPF